MTSNVSLEALLKTNAINIAVVSFTLAYMRSSARTGHPFSFKECYNDFLEAHSLKESEMSYKYFRRKFLYWSGQSKVSAKISPISHARIIQFIQTIRDSFIGSVTVFTQGSCFQFHQILSEIFDNYEVQPYQDKHLHVVSRIEGKYYDITGEVKGDFTELDPQEITRYQNNKFVIKWQTQHLIQNG